MEVLFQECFSFTSVNAFAPFVLLSFVCHSDIAFISIMVLFFSSYFLLPRPLIVFKSIVLLSLLNEAPILWPPDSSPGSGAASPASDPLDDLPEAEEPEYGDGHGGSRT